MNVYTIIQITGFYIISSIGIYKFLLTCNVDNPTLTESIIILIAIPYYPLMWLYDKVKILNRRHKKRKYIKQIEKEINLINTMISLETNKNELNKLYKNKSQLEDELYILKLLSWEENK